MMLILGHLLGFRFECLKHVMGLSRLVLRSGDQFLCLARLLSILFNILGLLGFCHRVRICLWCGDRKEGKDMVGIFQKQYHYL